MSSATKFEVDPISGFSANAEKLLEISQCRKRTNFEVNPTCSLPAIATKLLDRE